MELTIDQALQQGIAAHKEGRLQEAEGLYRAILQAQPQHPDANHNLGLIAVSANQPEAAFPLFEAALKSNPKIVPFWVSYVDALIKENRFEEAGRVLEDASASGVADRALDLLGQQLATETENPTPRRSDLNRLLAGYQNGRHDEAEKSALALTRHFPRHPFGWKVLGAIFQKSGRISDALLANQKSVELDPRDAEAHNNLGITLNDLGRLKDAEARYGEAIALKPDYAEAHYNLGANLQKQGRLEDARARYGQSIALKPDNAEAHLRVAYVLHELGRLEEAEQTCRQAVVLKPDYAEAQSKLGLILYARGDTDATLDCLESAHRIDPSSRNNKLFLKALRVRSEREKSQSGGAGRSNAGGDAGLTANPLILNRAVESDLIDCLYQIEARELDNGKDPSYGNIRGSDYHLFDDNHAIIRTVAADLENLIRDAVGSDVFVYDSFFSIFAAGGGTHRHNHINTQDKDPGLRLADQKYSLVYYLATGDQDCSEPGILKLYDPDEDVLPQEGMVVIFPARRGHSSAYGGNTDRIIIGLNFYSLT